MSTAAEAAFVVVTVDKSLLSAADAFATFCDESSALKLPKAQTLVR